MNVKELITELQKYPEDMDVMAKQTDFCGNIGNIWTVKKDRYGFVGDDVLCVLLTDESEFEEV